MNGREYARIKIAAANGNVEAQDLVGYVEGTGIDSVVKAAALGHPGANDFLNSMEAVFGAGTVKEAHLAEMGALQKEAAGYEYIPGTEETTNHYREYFADPAYQTVNQPGIGEVYDRQVYPNMDDHIANFAGQHPYMTALGAGLGAAGLGAAGYGAYRAMNKRASLQKEAAGLRDYYNNIVHGVPLAPKTDADAHAYREYFADPAHQTVNQPGIGEVYDRQVYPNMDDHIANFAGQHPYMTALGVGLGAAGLGAAGYGAYRAFGKRNGGR